MKINNRSRSGVKIDLILYYGLCFYLFNKSLDGFLRWFFELIGAGVLTFGSLIVVMISFGYYFSTSIKKNRITKNIFRTFLAIIVFVLIGMIYLPSFSQILFGLYIMIPLFYGYFSFNVIVEYKEKFILFNQVMFFIVVLGGLLDVLLDLPWSGFAFEVAGIEVQGSRSWTTYGIERVAGFSRASFSLAKQVLLFGLTMVLLTDSKFKNLIIWLIAGFIIVISTTKSLIVVWLLLSLIFLFKNIIHQFFLKIGMFLSLIFCVGLPISSNFYDYSDLLDKEEIVGMILSSYQTRLAYVWPRSFQMVEDGGNLIFGRGVGGIGTPGMGREAITSPGDNVFVYLFVLFGVFSIVIMGVLFFKSVTKNLYKTKEDFYFFCIMLIVLVFGMSSGIIEGAVISFYLGFTIYYLLNVRESYEELKDKENV